MYPVGNRAEEGKRIINPVGVKQHAQGGKEKGIGICRASASTTPSFDTSREVSQKSQINHLS